MVRRRIHPRRWTPPRLADPGATGTLRVARRLPTGGHGPEDVVFDRRGRILCGLADGRIVRLDPAGGEPTVLADTGGRPLGLHPCADGSVLVCDHDRGLLKAHPDGTVEQLAAVPFASNVVQAADGTIWFTASTTAWTLDDHLGDVFEHSCTGRLFRRDTDGAVTTVLDGLKFANGLVLAPDESHLLIAETTGYRIRRHWLTGPRAGSTEILVENLAGFPDNMSLGGDGLLWVGIAAPRDALLDRLLPLPGVLRTLLWNLPAAIRPKAVPIAWAMAFTLDGAPVHDLRAADGSYGFVTSAASHDGTVVLGSLTESDVAIVHISL
ncbi:SMP-30/gluconolactonase/LRE family protein [Actinoplanes utahensis]|uniref:Strictosidine synthase n=1 Tax=Actinoplanes utahensis TaxID=1869 RepID=A0A0A6XF57_ACTUT|nr:SMP-30/gluconolactonase/LRE family protein [Actinoplanes utahensis]KHD78727.1 strictosidine synthase [Actinoplanes utahensis]GIF32081.1 strictosidine synthase [Actinoplanes utahensis]